MDQSDSELIYRTQITIRNPNDWQRLHEWEVLVLEQGADWALVLVDELQLERLARLGFAPRSSDGLASLVTGHAQEKPLIPSRGEPNKRRVRGWGFLIGKG